MFQDDETVDLSLWQDGDLRDDLEIESLPEAYAEIRRLILEYGSEYVTRKVKLSVVGFSQSYCKTGRELLESALA